MDTINPFIYPVFQKSPKTKVLSIYLSYMVNLKYVDYTIRRFHKGSIRPTKIKTEKPEKAKTIAKFYLTFGGGTTD